MTDDPTILLRTDRLLIRLWRPDEADRFLDLYRRIEVIQWFGQAATAMQNRQEALQRIERIAAKSKNDPRLGRWAVVERSSGVPAGTVILQRLPNGDGEIEIGWHLHPDSWGRGYATEAARALLERAFQDGFDEVWAVTDPENHRSAAVCRRIGMRLLGITHRWYPEPSLMFWAGAYPAQRPSLPPDQPEPGRQTSA